jgi:hypothetical protein
MTEADWLRCDDINRMQRFAVRRASRRKRDLFLCAVFNQITLLLPACSFLQRRDGRQWDLKPQNLNLREPIQPEQMEVARGLLEVFWPVRERVPDDEAQRLQAILPPLARCVFGNPFRPVTIDAAWLTPTVRALAQAAYDEPEPLCEMDAGRLAVLADAMEEAGADGELLAHLRGPGPHARGCFALDAILGLG